MGVTGMNLLVFVLLVFAFSEMQTIAGAKIDNVSCNFRKSPCFAKKIQCPAECPLKSPSDPNAKICSLDCASPVCKAQCKRKFFILLSFPMKGSLFIYLFIFVK